MRKMWKSFMETEFFKTHHQELIIIPVLILGFALISLMLSSAFPHSDPFDVPSQLETLFYYSLKIVSVLTISWFAFRISLPPLYSRFSSFYHGKDCLDERTRTIIAIALFAVFMLAGAIISRGDDGKGGNKGGEKIRAELKVLLDSQLDIREVGINRGKEIDKFNTAVKVPLGSFWCGSYVAYDLNYFHIPNPNSAWSPSYGNPKDVIWTFKKGGKKLLLGDVFTQYYASLGRIGHVGFYLKTDTEGFFIVQAGNTSGPGSRNGDRVAKHKISPEKIHTISRYIQE